MACVQPSTGERESEKQKSTNQVAGKTRKIRVYPTPSQRKILNNWFGTARWTYNRCLEALNQGKVGWKKKELRALCLNNANFEGTDKDWVLHTPYDVRDEGMNDLLKAFKSNFSVKERKVTKFKMKFRSKKAQSESIVIHKKNWKKAGVFYPTFFGTEPLAASETLPDRLDYDCRLQRTRLGQFYFCLLLPLDIVGDNQAPKFENAGDEIVALDPGVRTFMTGYSPSGLAFEWGKQDIERLFFLCRLVDKLQGKSSQSGIAHRKRWRLKRKASRVRQRIRNLVDEAHKKLSKWLVSSFRTILLPVFGTSTMVRRAHRKISSISARQMLTWSHYRFQQRLLSKAREHPWCRVIICDEDYTSVTCGRCGKLHKNLGGKKTFRCPSCLTVLDRDVNGARNILLRYMTLNELQVSFSSRGGLRRILPDTGLLREPNSSSAKTRSEMVTFS